MGIGLATVRRIAALARLELADDEAERLAGELDAIVGYVDQLQAVDTGEVQGVSNVNGLCNVTRPDEPGAMLLPVEVLANAPRCSQQGFLVPKAVDR